MADVSPANQARTDLAEQYKTQKAQKEALQASHESEMENLKKSYTAEKIDTEDRFVASEQAEKASHYDHLRTVKSQLNREERQLDQQRNAIINQKTNQIGQEETKVDQEGRTKISDAIRKYAMAEEYERNKAAAAEQLVKTNHHADATLILNDSQKKLEALAEEKSTYLEKQKALHVQGLNEIEGHYDGIRHSTETQYASEVGHMNEKAQTDLNEKRIANATMISSFDAKQNDPFYTMRRFDSDLSDAGDAYILRVKVPEYERNQFKLQVSGQEIQLTGIRSSDEKATLEQGRSIATRSYQNVTERYALASPVDGRSITYQEDGERLVYTIPKFGPNHRISDQYRNPKNVGADLESTKELEFKNTLPTPTNVSRIVSKS